jgi:class 3 adenylate cyclase
MQLIGDSVFAVWNASERRPNHPLLACRAALVLRDRFKQFNAETQDFPLETRLGFAYEGGVRGQFGLRGSF